MTDAKHTALTEAQRKVLSALAEPGSRTIIGGLDVCAVFELERRGMVASNPDPLFPRFLAYRVTDVGRAALAKAQQEG